MARALSPLMAAFLMGWLFATAATAQQFPSGEVAEKPAVDTLKYEGPPRKQDDVLLVNTRAFGKPAAEGSLRWDLRRHNEAGRWQSISTEALSASTRDGAPTVVYVHGYGYETDKAARVGWAFYHALCADLPANQRVRYIVWSWPTKALRFRPRTDVADKARRADEDAYRLAQLLTKIEGDGRVCVVGSALGCRVVEGAMHLAGGGKLGEWELDQGDARGRPRISAAFISAAVHDDWLREGGYHDRALAGTDRLLLINNSRDATLRRYGIVYRRGVRALGLDGMQRPSDLGDAGTRIEQFDAHEEIGENHGVENYLRNAEVTRRLREFALGK